MEPEELAVWARWGKNSVLYQIFVKKEDLDKARYVIRGKLASETNP